MTSQRHRLAGYEKLHDGDLVDLQRHLHTDCRVGAYFAHEVEDVEPGEWSDENAGSGVETTSVIELDVIEEDDVIL